MIKKSTTLVEPNDNYAMRKKFFIDLKVLTSRHFLRYCAQVYCAM
jgi:hypothetical protein